MNLSIIRKKLDQLDDLDRPVQVVEIMKLQCEQNAVISEQLSNLINILSDGEDIETPAKAKIKRAKTDPVPIKKIIDLYNQCKRLPKINVVSNGIKSNIRARWKSDKKYQNIKFWLYLFEYCDSHKFLSGQVMQGERKPFKANLEWIIKEANFTKIQNNYYDK
jgi:hypothetical protein